MTNEILQKIKSKGYWKIVIMPFEYKKERIRLGDIKQIVERSHVMKRGWPYPFTYQAGDTFASDLISNEYYSTDVDWEKHIEIWRMYKSGQFVQYLALREDWTNEESDRFSDRKFLDIIMTLYTITEIFLFISNLGARALHDDRVTVHIELNDLYCRQLGFYFRTYEGLRELDSVYKCKMQEPIVIDKTLNTQDVDTSIQSISMNATEEVFEKFGWRGKTEDILKNDQQKFLKGFV